MSCELSDEKEVLSNGDDKPEEVKQAVEWIDKEFSEKKDEKAFRTAALTAASAQSPVTARTTTLRCNYCPTGFLVCSGKDVEPKENSADEEKKELAVPITSTPPFACVDCGKSFDGGFPFVVRIVAELSLDIAYWQKKLAEARQQNSSSNRGLYSEAGILAMWRKVFYQLGKLLNDTSLRLVTASLDLAEAYRWSLGKEVEEERQLLTSALEVLLSDVYEPLEAVGEKRALLEAMTRALVLLKNI